MKRIRPSANPRLTQQPIQSEWARLEELRGADTRAPLRSATFGLHDESVPALRGRRRRGMGRVLLHEAGRFAATAKSVATC